jgi:anhydro-N-acetylmuramic acid kinase
MAIIYRFDAAHHGEPPRWTLGVLVSSGCRRVDAALVAATGRGLAMRAEVKGAKSLPVPDDTAAAFRQLVAGAGGPDAPEMVAQLRADLAEIEAELIATLPAESGVAESRVLAAAVGDPGLWSQGKASSPRYLGLCDAARVAEVTGVNIIDALPGRDLAQRGQGGPLTAVAEWILLRDPGCTRVLVDLGQTVRMSLLPPESDPWAASRILSFDVGPGMRLLDVFARRLTGGEHPFDPGGRLAVQGTKIAELLEHWLADPWFDRPLPRWHPHGVRPERFLNDAIQMAVEADWSVRDLLCTATHLVAESVVRAVARRLPGKTPVGHIVLTGGGRQNGMLLREIAARLPEATLTPIDDLGIAERAFGPACIAMLAFCHLDQVPANPTAVTGAEIPRVLGRLTPGSPQGWQRLLSEMSGRQPAIRPLRSAI